MLVYLYRNNNLHTFVFFSLLNGLRYDQWHLPSKVLFMGGMQSPGLRRFLVSRFLHAMVYTDVPQIPTTDTWWSQSARNLVTCSRLPHRPQLVSQSAANQTFFALRVTMGQNNNNGVFMKPCQALLITAHPQSKPSAPVRNIRQALIKAAVKQREAVVCLRLPCSFCSHLSTKTQLLASSLCSAITPNL